MKCPRDENYLSPFGSHEQAIIQCNCCKGFVVKSDTVPPVKSFRQSAEIVVQPVVLACPYCLKDMQAIHYSGIEIDICSECHLVWLDAGEYEKIATLCQETNPTNLVITSIEKPSPLLDKVAETSVVGEVVGWVILVIGSLLGGT
jgi:ribosomal protein L31